MTKYAHKTRVVINGQDVSPLIFRVNIPRDPGAVEVAELTIQTDHLEVDDDGTLVIHIETPLEVKL